MYVELSSSPGANIEILNKVLLSQWAAFHREQANHPGLFRPEPLIISPDLETIQTVESSKGERSAEAVNSGVESLDSVRHGLQNAEYFKLSNKLPFMEVFGRALYSMRYRGNNPILRKAFGDGDFYLGKTEPGRNSKSSVGGNNKTAKLSIGKRIVGEHGLTLTKARIPLSDVEARWFLVQNVKPWEDQLITEWGPKVLVCNDGGELAGFSLKTSDLRDKTNPPLWDQAFPERWAEEIAKRANRPMRGRKKRNSKPSLVVNNS